MPGDKPHGDIERFIWHPGDATLYRVKSQCRRCRHYLPSRNQCKAFPDGVPGVIFDNEHDHRKPYDGDHGVRWDPLPILEGGRPTGRRMTHPIDDNEPDKEVIA